MELLVKIADCIQLLTIFAKPFILGVLQRHEYASDEAKQNPVVFSLILQKIRTTTPGKFLHF